MFAEKAKFIFVRAGHRGKPVAPYPPQNCVLHNVRELQMPNEALRPETRSFSDVTSLFGVSDEVRLGTSNLILLCQLSVQTCVA